MARNVLILCQVGQTFQERFVIVKKTLKNVLSVWAQSSFNFHLICHDVFL